MTSKITIHLVAMLVMLLISSAAFVGYYLKPSLERELLECNKKVERLSVENMLEIVKNPELVMFCRPYPDECWVTTAERLEWDSLNNIQVDISGNLLFEKEYYNLAKLLDERKTKQPSRECVEWNCGVKTIITYPKLVCSDSLSFYKYKEELKNPCNVQIPAFTLYYNDGNSFTVPTLIGSGLEFVEIDVNSCAFKFIEGKDGKIPIEPNCLCYSDEPCAKEKGGGFNAD